MRKTLQRVALLSGGIFCASWFVSATVYTWVDEKGVTHFSQTKPNDVSDAEELAVKQTNAFDAQSNVNSQVAANNNRTNRQAAGNTNKTTKSADECWKKGNSLGFLIAAADELQGKEKADYVKMLTEQKRALEKECGKNSNAWSN